MYRRCSKAGERSSRGVGEYFEKVLNGSSLEVQDEVESDEAVMEIS